MAVRYSVEPGVSFVFGELVWPTYGLPATGSEPMPVLSIRRSSRQSTTPSARTAAAIRSHVTVLIVLGDGRGGRKTEDGNGYSLRHAGVAQLVERRLPKP